MATRLLAITALTVSLAYGMRRPGEEIKPGFNLFSKQQDIQLGLQAAAQVRKQYRPVSNQELQDYIRRIGGRTKGGARVGIQLHLHRAQ